MQQRSRVWKGLKWKQGLCLHHQKGRCFHFQSFLMSRWNRERLIAARKTEIYLCFFTCFSSLCSPKVIERASSWSLSYQPFQIISKQRLGRWMQDIMSVLPYECSLPSLSLFPWFLSTVRSGLRKLMKDKARAWKESLFLMSLFFRVSKGSWEFLGS